MPYFFSEHNLNLGKLVEISSDEARHLLLSHRVKIGEKIKLQGPDGKRFLCEVISLGKNKLSLKPVLEQLVPVGPSVQVALFQAVVSEKALDFIFQKCTELGISEIVLFNSERTALKINKALYEKKMERWQKILLEAVKQSERAKIPELKFIFSFQDVCVELGHYGKVILADPQGQKLALGPASVKNVAYIIGPEGGFTEGEVNTLKDLKNLMVFSLGSILLRAETAAIAVLAIIRFVVD